MSLPKFEGKEVTGAQVRITGAGDSLSEALEVEPVALHYGQEVTYVIKTKVEQVNHRPLDAKHLDIMVRQHTCKVQEITEIDGDVAEEFLSEARAALAAKRPEEQKSLDDEV
jgi:hypothetical protein